MPCVREITSSILNAKLGQSQFICYLFKFTNIGTQLRFATDIGERGSDGLMQTFDAVRCRVEHTNDAALQCRGQRSDQLLLEIRRAADHDLDRIRRQCVRRPLPLRRLDDLLDVRSPRL